MTDDNQFQDPASFAEASYTPDFASQIDGKNGWEERGNPQLGFDEAADELEFFFYWMLTGRKRGASDKLAQRDIERSLQNPEIIGRRMIAAIRVLHPELIGCKTWGALAKKCGGSLQNLAKISDSFFYNFPVFLNRIQQGSRGRKRKAIINARKSGI